MTQKIKNNKVGVISAGAWGTALAIAANRAGSEVTLYTSNPNVLESITNKRINDVYLPGIFIEPNIKITADLGEICKNNIIILSIPSQHIRSMCIKLSDQIDTDTILVIATKGIERGSLALMSDVVSSILPQNPVAILGGPNFAIEVAKGLPTATTIACRNEQTADKIIYAIGGKYFRPYNSDDLIGTQIGGAIKNVIAIACGIAIGRGFGENARAALITRGIAEMGRLCAAKGGRQETLMGLSGLGDLMLSCSSEVSRNMSLGIEIGKQEKTAKQIIDNRKKGLAEGVATADSASELAKKIGVSMPICQTVREILYEERNIDEAISSLLERRFVAEVTRSSF